MIPKSILLNAKQVPAPNRYDCDLKMMNKKKGRSFGISYSSFQKLFLEHAPDNVNLD